MSASRRYEILLPLRFNDGQPVPNESIGETLQELRRQFGAVSWETQIVRGQWQHESKVFDDDSMRVVIDVDDIPANREFFRQFKECLKVRFRQIDIWMTTHPIDVV
jgi:hypothetical protein